MALRAVFFDVGNTLIQPHPSVSEVVRQILAEEGHIHDLTAIDEIMPLVDEYYEDRYRSDDTFWTDEGRTAQVERPGVGTPQDDEGHGVRQQAHRRERDQQPRIDLDVTG